MTTAPAANLDKIQFFTPPGASRREGVKMINLHSGSSYPQLSQPSAPPNSHSQSAAQSLPKRPPQPQPPPHPKHPLPSPPNSTNLTPPAAPPPQTSTQAPPPKLQSKGTTERNPDGTVDKEGAQNCSEKLSETDCPNPAVKLEEDDQDPAAVINQISGPGSSKNDPIVLDEPTAPTESQAPQIGRKLSNSSTDTLPTSPPPAILTQKVSKCGRRRSECDDDVVASDDDSSAPSPSRDSIREAAPEAKRPRSLQKEYPVKVISGSKIVQTEKGLRLMYKVKWAPSWEPSEHLECDDLVAEFHKKNPTAASPANLTRVAKRKMGVLEAGRKKRKMQSASQRSLGLGEIHGPKKQLLDLPTELLCLIWDFIFHDTLAMHPEKTKVFGWRLVCREFNAILLHLAYRALKDGPKRIDPRKCSCLKYWKGSLGPLQDDALMGIDITPWKSIVGAEFWRKRCDCKELDQLLIPNLPNKLIVRILLNGLNLAPPNSLTTVIRRVDERSRFGLLYLSVLRLGRVRAVLYFTRAREQKLSPSVEKNYPFVLSAYQGRPCRADTSDPIFGSTSLAAIVGGHIDTVTGLLHRGYPTGLDWADRLDWAGRTLGHWAAIRGFCQLTKMVPIPIRDRRGRTPLSYAAEHNHVSMIKQIPMTLSELDFFDRRGRCPLHYAAKEGHLEVLNTLLAYEPSIVSSRDGAGMTAEQLAARGGHKEAETFLRDVRIRRAK